MLEKTLDSPLDCKEIQPVHPKGDQSWMFIGRTDVEAETLILWPPDVKSWLIWKDPDAGKDWRQEKKGTTEDEMVRWHHRLDGHGFGWTPGVGDGQTGLACCGSWGCKESDTTEQLNWTESQTKLKSQKFINIYIHNTVRIWLTNSEVAQSCPTLCDSMDCSPPGSSVHGNFPGKSAGVGCHFLFQGIFLTQGLNPSLPHRRQTLYRLSHQWSPWLTNMK